jgi:hypothetical protein
MSVLKFPQSVNVMVEPMTTTTFIILADIEEHVEQYEEDGTDSSYTMNKVDAEFSYKLYGKTSLFEQIHYGQLSELGITAFMKSTNTEEYSLHNVRITDMEINLNLDGCSDHMIVTESNKPVEPTPPPTPPQSAN